MKRTIFTLILSIVFSALAIPGHAEQIARRTETVLSANAGISKADIDRKKKRKLKKKVRQAGRVYKLVKPEKQDKKKARKVQRKIRRVINIW
jgi:hypothetical protein